MSPDLPIKIQLGIGELEVREADQDVLDLMRSRSLEQDVLDILDAPPFK